MDTDRHSDEDSQENAARPRFDPGMRLPFSGLTREAWLRLADAAALFTLLVVSVAVITAASSYPSSDFPVFHAAARLVVSGGNPYDPAQVAALLREMVHAGQADPDLPPYFYYPPWLCWILSPLSLLRFEWARAVWLALNTMLLAAGAWLTCRANGWRPRIWQWAVAGIAIAYPLGWVALGSGQVSTLVFFALSAATYVLVRSPVLPSRTASDVLAGGCLCLALTKPQDGLLPALIVSALFLRQRRALAPGFAVIVTLGTVLASVFLLPDWWTKIDLAAALYNLSTQAQPTGVVAARVNATLRDWLAGFGVVGHAADAIWVAVAIACAILIARLVKSRISDGYLVSLVTVVSFLVTPYAFEYDYVVAVPAILWSLWLASTGGRPERMVRLALLLAIFTSHLWGRWMSDAYWIPLLISVMLVSALLRRSLEPLPRSGVRAAGPGFELYG